MRQAVSRGGAEFRVLEQLVALLLVRELAFPAVDVVDALGDLGLGVGGYALRAIAHVFDPRARVADVLLKRRDLSAHILAGLAVLRALDGLAMLDPFRVHAIALARHLADLRRDLLAPPLLDVSVAVGVELASGLRRRALLPA